MKFFEPLNPHCKDFANRVTKARRAVECATQFTAVSELHHNLLHANFTNSLFNRSAFQR